MGTQEGSATLRGAACHASVDADMVLTAEVEERERAARGIVKEEFIALGPRVFWCVLIAAVAASRRPSALPGRCSSNTAEL